MEGPPIEEDPAVCKRRAIQVVMKDASLTQIKEEHANKGRRRGEVIQGQAGGVGGSACNPGGYARGIRNDAEDPPDEEDASVRKRRAIQAVM